MFAVDVGLPMLLYIYIYIYILAAYTRRCPTNVNMKHYASHSNFGLIGPLISFWHTKKKLPVGMATIKPHHA